MNISEQIQKIVAEVLEINSDQIGELSSEDSLSSYGMDSINCVDIVLTIEEELDVVFKDEELLLENLNSLSKLTKLVEQKKQENSVALG